MLLKTETLLFYSKNVYQNTVIVQTFWQRTCGDQSTWFNFTKFYQNDVFLFWLKKKKNTNKKSLKKHSRVYRDHLLDC